MKTNWLQRLKIIIHSGLIMLSTFCAAIWHGMRGTITAEWVDEKSRSWSRRVLAIVNASYSVHNPHHFHPEKNERYILMCNHTSHYDIPLSFVAIEGSIRMVAKKELGQLPIMGAAMKAAKFPTIDRKNRDKAIKELEQIQKMMAEGVMIWICPEGTRSLDGQLQALKKGGFIMAINTGAKIIPLAIKGANRILPAKTWDFQLNQHVDIHIGEAIDAKQYTLENKEALVAEYEKRMRELLS